MANRYTDEDDDLDEREDRDRDRGGDGDRTNDEWAKLRREKAARKQAEADADAQKRENAFLRAGIDPADPKMKYFAAGYDGEVDAESIRKAAVEAGFMEAQVTPDPATTPEAQAQAQAQAAAQQVAAASLPPLTGPNAAEQALIDAHREGGSAAMIAKAQEMGLRVAEGD